MDARLAFLARSSTLGFSALLFVGSCLALASWPGLAGADPGPEFVAPTDLASEPVLPVYGQCPEPLPPEPLESEDPAAVQTYELRRDQRAVCVATVERLDQVATRQWWIVSQLLGEQAEAKLIREHLERAEGNDLDRNEVLREVNNAFTSGPLKTELTGIDAENPLPVSGLGGGEGSPEETAELVAAIDASGEGNMTALYLLAGLMVALFIGAALSRTVDRGT